MLSSEEAVKAAVFSAVSAAIIAVIFAAVWGVIKLICAKKGKEANSSVGWVFVSVLCIYIAATSFIANLGWIRLVSLMTMFALIHPAMLIGSSITGGRHSRESARVKVQLTWAHICYVAANLLMPDGGDEGGDYMFYSLIWPETKDDSLLVFAAAIGVASIFFMLNANGEFKNVGRKQALSNGKSYAAATYTADAMTTVADAVPADTAEISYAAATYAADEQLAAPVEEAAESCAQTAADAPAVQPAADFAASADDVAADVLNDMSTL